MRKSDEKCECGCGKSIDEPEFDLEIETEKARKKDGCKCKNDQNCDCGHECDCEHDCNCNSDCDCGDDCKCDENHKCSDNCTCGDSKNYLSDLLRVQAEFDNYRKRMQSALLDARNDGFVDAIEGFLPALDSFKMATDMITDKNTLIGIKYIEKGILDTLSKMGVEAIDATGKFDPELHQAVDTDNSADVESGYIVKEACKGFTYKGKVIRYSQVIVKK